VKDIDFAINVDKSVPKTLKSDERRLK
jgi:anti-sigma regulatory factor (Ser/Thr protein kinase)